MSERPITVGDLVVVVKPSFCNGSTKDVGLIFQVHEIELNGGGACTECNKYHGMGMLFAHSNGVYGWWPLRRIKRIPPLEHLDGCSEDARKIVKEPT